MSNFTQLEFQGHMGPGILAPAGGFLASLERMFAPLTFSTIIIIIRKMFVPPCMKNVCSPGTNNLFVPRGQTKGDRLTD